MVPGSSFGMPDQVWRLFPAILRVKCKLVWFNKCRIIRFENVRDVFVCPRFYVNMMRLETLSHLWPAEEIQHRANFSSVRLWRARRRSRFRAPGARAQCRDRRKETSPTDLQSADA